MNAGFAGPAAVVLRAVSDPGSFLDRLQLHDGGLEPLAEWQTRAVIVAGTPYTITAAAEREQIRQLAVEREATAWSHPLWHNECSRVPFADLIGEGS